MSVFGLKLDLARFDKERRVQEAPVLSGICACRLMYAGSRPGEPAVLQSNSQRVEKYLLER